MESKNNQYNLKNSCFNYGFSFHERPSWLKAATFNTSQHIKNRNRKLSLALEINLEFTDMTLGKRMADNLKGKL